MVRVMLFSVRKGLELSIGVFMVFLLYVSYYSLEEGMHRKKSTSPIGLTSISERELSYDVSDTGADLTESINQQSNLPFTADETSVESAVRQRLEARRKEVQAKCQNKGSGYCHFKSNFKFHQYLFYGYNTTICSIAKAGSSTWRAHLRRVNNGPPSHIPIYKDDLRVAFYNRSTEVILKDILASTKIITVRHPLTRLVSAFRNKYQNGRGMPSHRPRIEEKKRKIRSGSYWDDRFFQFWLPAMFANDLYPPDIHLKVGLKEPIDPKIRYNVWVYERLYDIKKPTIDFNQFLIYVIKSVRDGKADGHWSSYLSDCCPCYYEYEFITKLETLTEDLKYIFKYLGIPSDPSTSKNQYRHSVADAYNDLKYFKHVPDKIKREVYEVFKPEMDYFGYEVPEHFLKD